MTTPLERRQADLAAQRATLLAAIRSEVGRGASSTTALAKRAGVTERTIQRLLSGETCSDEALSSVARVLRVEWLTVEAVADAVDQARPVSGWKEASRLLGLSHDTLLRRRKRWGITREPWWPSREALLEWYGRLAETAGSATEGA